MRAFHYSIAVTLLSLLVQNMEWYFGGLHNLCMIWMMKKIW
jgi:hypothetical protein